MNEQKRVEALVRVDELRKTYDGGSITALDGLNLSVDRGEMVAVMGPSGSGKSTLLQLVAALEKPTSGSIRVDDLDVTRLRRVDHYRRQEVGLVFQLHNLLPHLTASQNVEIAMMATGRHRSARRERARELLAQADLADKVYRHPPELSGGERQRVAIARALANDPPLILADEPTGSLDTVAVDRVLALFQSLRDEQGVTIILATHDDHVAEAADRTVHLRDGRLVTTVDDVGP